MDQAGLHIGRIVDTAGTEHIGLWTKQADPISSILISWTFADDVDV